MAEEAKAPTESQELYRRWLAEIELYEREAEKWISRSKKVVKLYKDEDNAQGKRKRFNILWSNVQTLKPALYARDPKPEVERRFKDADPLGRAASEVLERSVTYTVSCHGFSSVMKQCVEDRLLPGRGTAWARYVPTLDGEGDDQKLTYEQAIPDYVYWEDFGHCVARTWEEVPCVWRKVYMTRAKLIKRFGEVGKSIPLDHTPKNLKDEKAGEHGKKACIYEGWDKEAGTVWFLSKSYPELIEYKDAPIKLTGGFPCPEPLYATVTNDSRIPVPDYALYQTQAQELEDLTARIDSLQKALKVVGVYDSSAPALGTLLSGSENKMVPVEKWAAFAEKGGLKGAVDFLPIKEVAEVLIGLYEARDKVKQDLYEITGIADIIRGNSEPNETATAQQIKGRFAVLRISDAQADVQRFARDIIRLLSEIIAEHFSLETIRAISGVKLLTQVEKEGITAQLPPNQPVPDEIAQQLKQPTWEEVHGLLRNDVLRNFRIDVETDSTIRTDEDADRQSRTEFLAAAGSYINQATQALQVAPEMGPLMAELLMFGVRSHRSSRTLEPVFDDAIRKMQSNMGKQKPDPEMQKVQAQMQLEQQKMQMQSQLEQTKAQTQAQLEISKQQAQSQQEMERMQMEVQRGQAELQQQGELERFKAQLQSELEREKAVLERETALQVEQIKAASAERIAQINASAKIQGDAMKAEAQADMAERQAEHEGEQADKDRKSNEKLAAQKAKSSKEK